MKGNGRQPVFCFLGKALKKKRSANAKKESGKKGSDTARTHLTPDKRKEMVARVTDHVRTVCAAEGMELVHVAYQRESGGWTLRIYIDTPGGVTLDDCVHISRQLSDLLDVIFEPYGPYRLEVSSPGPDRPLAKKEDFERFKGQVARIRRVEPVEGQKNFTGVLAGVSNDGVTLLIADKKIAIPFGEIRSARLRPNPSEK